MDNETPKDDASKANYTIQDCTFNGPVIDAKITDAIIAAAHASQEHAKALQSIAKMCEGVAMLVIGRDE